jgi:hypothetical protein
MSITKSQHLLIAGSYQYTVDFDPNAGTISQTSSGGTDTFFGKYSSNGDIVWIKSIGGSGEEDPVQIKEFDNGEILLVGRYDSGIDMNPSSLVNSLTSQGYTDTYIGKYSSSGAYIWGKSFGGWSAVIRPYSAATDQAGAALITGEFNNIIDFDPSTAIKYDTAKGSSNSDIFIAKLDATGQLVWQRSPGSTGVEVGRSIVTDPVGNIYCSGTFRGSVNFNEGGSSLVISTTTVDGYLLKLNPGGTALYAYAFKGSGATVPKSTFVSSDGTIITAGTFTGVNDMDLLAMEHNVVATGTSNDLFLSYYKEELSSSSIINASFCENDSYSLPSGTVVTVPGTYHDTLSNTLNADSTITIYLNQTTIDTSVGNRNDTLFTVESNANYQWYSCDSAKIIAGAVNSEFNAPYNGLFSVIISKEGCTDTSNCYRISTVDIKEVTKEFSFSVYPNPTSASFRIISENELINKVTLYDLAGHEVLEVKGDHKNIFAYDLSSYENGVYFISINNSSKIMKLILIK